MISSEFLHEWSSADNSFQDYWINLSDNTLWLSGVFSTQERYIYILDEDTDEFYLYISLS